MNKLEKAYFAVKRLDKRRRSDETSPALIIVTLIYLVAVLSVSIYSPQKLIWLAAYPIIYSEIKGIGYAGIFIKSLWLLPLLVMIGCFNPIFDTVPAFDVNGFKVSRGWVSFVSILLRGLLSFQALLLMIEETGFIDIFNLMRHAGFPKVLCTQMLLTYRYFSVILEEAIVMSRARESRGYGRKSYPLRIWGRFIGQLLIRSVHRATNVHRAMKARGFTGTLPLGREPAWTAKGWINLLAWGSVIIMLRFIDFSTLLIHFIK